MGKIAISDSILLKPGRLTKEEFELMKTHTVEGSEIIEHMKGIGDGDYEKVSYDIARYHHERFDGRGYPDGLVGDEIPIAAQIVAVAADWSATFNDVTVPYGAGGFSVKANPQGTKTEDGKKKTYNYSNLLFRVPKEDTSYDYYEIGFDTPSNQPGNASTPISRTNAGRFFLSTDTEFTLTATNNLAGNLYYLVGNPFPCGLDMKAFFDVNTDLEKKYWLLTANGQSAAIARTKDLINWERLPDLKTKSQQRNVVLHPEFVEGKYAFYTRPQDGFIDTGSGGGIGWALVDDITHAEIKEEKIINARHYHTIQEVKNGEGPHPIKTDKGWLHLAHGVRGCASGLRYVLYMYMTSLEDPTKVIAEPGGYLLVPQGEEYIGDVMNVVFTNGWIADEDGKVFIYYASSDTRMHVATSTIDRLVDYCMNTPADGYRTQFSVETIKKLVAKNKSLNK